MHNCGILVPFWGTGSMGTDKVHRECLLPQGHTTEDDNHVFLRNDGMFIIWMMDPACGCEDEECECYVSGELEPDAALNMLKDLPYLVQPLLNQTWRVSSYDHKPRHVDPAQLELDLRYYKTAA